MDEINIKVKPLEMSKNEQDRIFNILEDLKGELNEEYQILLLKAMYSLTDYWKGCAKHEIEKLKKQFDEMLIREIGF